MGESEWVKERGRLLKKERDGERSERERERKTRRV